MLKVLVTGGSGFLGRYVLERLTREPVAARLVSRRPTGAPDEVVVSSLCDVADWQPALSGIDAVVHLAGLAHKPPKEQEALRDLYVRTNTDATIALAQAAARHGVRHFVYLSSIAVNGPSTDGRAPFRESDEPRPATVYGETKATAEDGLRRLGRDMVLSIVRPPMIYGRDAKGSFPRLAKAVRLGLPLPFRSVANRRAFVAADNVADFVASRLHASEGGTFIVADDEQVSTPEFIRRLGKALARPARLLPFPPALLKAGLNAAGKGDMVESLLGSLEVDSGRARATGWRPPLDLNEGLRRAVA